MYVFTEDSSNYYITFDNIKVEFNSLHQIKDPENIKKLFFIYADFRYEFFDFSEFINIECLELILASSSVNINLGNLDKLKYLLIDGLFSDPEEGHRIINNNIDFIDISGCPNLIYLYIIDFKNLKEVKFIPLKKLCRFVVMIKDYNKLLINEYNKFNIQKNKESVKGNKNIISRRRIYILAETPLKGPCESEEGTQYGLAESPLKGPCESQEGYGNRTCPKCGKNCKEILLVNTDIINCFEQLFIYDNVTYTCC